MSVNCLEIEKKKKWTNKNYGPTLNSRKSARGIYVFIFVSVIVACDVRHSSSYILSHEENQFHHFIYWKICLVFTGLWCGLCLMLFSYPWVSISGLFNLFYLFFPKPAPWYVNYYSLTLSILADKESEYSMLFFKKEYWIFA